MAEPFPSIHVIDPDLKFRRLVLGALEPFALRIIQSTNLREADLELPVAHPDLIIMDCLQPDGDGLEWLRQKRENGLKAPVILLNSGCHSTKYFCELVRVPGVKVVLQKPITAATLQSVFDEHFGKAQDQEQAQAQTQAPQSSAAPSQAQYDDIEMEMKALALEYVRELPGRFAVLLRQVQDARVGRGELTSAKSEAHKIKGTAASYGFYAIGEQAVIIDACLKKLVNDASTNTAEVWNSLEAALNEALRLAFEACALAEAESGGLVPAVYDSRIAMSNVGLSNTNGQKIVIVDDDEDFTKRISLALGYEDMIVYGFNDAKQIIDVLEFLRPDLLLLDLNMPDLDGFEVCKRIRIDSRWRNLPIIFLTAQTGWETRVAAFDSGADDYIPKPVVNQELIARIRVRADKSRLQDVVTSQSSVNKLLWQALLLVLMQQEQPGAV